MNFKPLGEFVLIKPLAKENPTGIILNSEPKPDQGIVVAVGTGRVSSTGTLIPLSVNVDDRVMFHEGSTDPLTVDNELFYLLREQSIVAIVTE